MAEPARQHEADIQPDIRPDLHVVKGGGETTSGRGDLSAVPDLKDKEESAAAQAGSGRHLRSVDSSNLGGAEGTGGWATNVNKDQADSGGVLDKNKFQKMWGVAKKRGGPLGLLALFGITGGIMASILGPATMIINLMENFADTNDSSSTSMERRFIKVFENATKKDVCKSKKIKCKMGRISNSALRKLERKGLKPCFDGKCDGTKKRTGYPSKNPTHYEIDGKRIAAKDLSGFLSQKENRKYARKVFGVGGAFNLRFRAWAGKYIATKFYKKFDLKRNGGLADGQNNTKMTPKERAKAALDKLRGGIPETSEGESGFKDKIKANIDKRLSKAKKGGPVYLAAAAGCLGVKAPRLIVAGFAAIQLAQILPVVMDTVLSPGGKAKASGATGEDLDTIGTMLTETTPREGDGKMTSALDSPYLLSAMGVNTNKPPVSKGYTPGYSILALAAIAKGIKAEKATQKECDVVLSPQAMYTAAAIDSAATVAASATIIGGIVKVIAGFVVSEIVAKIAVKAAGSLAGKAFNYFAENDNIPKARGQALGDVLGIAAPAFFASGGMSHHLPTLKKSQLSAYNQVKQENESFHREMDIAALSPFDTSSKYTFLGSIVRNIKTAAVTNNINNSGLTLGSALLGIGSLPSYAFSSPNASAEGELNYNSCDYAKDFEIVESDVAINVAGLPCTGITPQQANMPTSTATDLMVYEGWLDESKSTNDGDTIQDLVESEYIKKDTPLYDYIDQCSNPDTGDYLFNSAACSIDCAGSCTGSLANKDECFNITNEDGTVERKCGSTSGQFDDSEVESVKDPRSLVAIPDFLLDYQIVQAMNGEDEEEDESSSSASAASVIVPSVSLGDVTFPLKGSKSVVNNPGIFANGTTAIGGHPYTAYDIYADAGTEVAAFASGKVTSLHSSSSLGKGVSVYNEQNGIVVYYTHMASTSVQVDDTIAPGDVLGTLASVNTYPDINVDHLHIDASTDRVRQACSRSSCPITDHFRGIGPDLFSTYQALPD